MKRKAVVLNSGVCIRLAMVRSGPDCGLFWRLFKKTGPYSIKTATEVGVRAIQDHKVIEFVIILESIE
jgi:hypothetical protein